MRETNCPRQKISQEAGMDQSNQSWRGKGEKVFEAPREKMNKFAAASSDVTAR
jgi:hypothetical protein